jgi:hypothetical protein
MVSGISMVCHWTRFTTGQANLEKVTSWYPILWAKGLKHALRVKRGLNPTRCVDVYHQDLSKDPVKGIEKIYSHFDMALSQGAKKRMQVWLRDNPRTKFGNHSYTAEQYGFSPDKVMERFGFYYDDFDLNQ